MILFILLVMSTMATGLVLAWAMCAAAKEGDRIMDEYFRERTISPRRRRDAEGATIPKTDRPGTQPRGTVTAPLEGPKGLGRAGNKPLMQNQEAHETPAPIGLLSPALSPLNTKHVVNGGGLTAEQRPLQVATLALIRRAVRWCNAPRRKNARRHSLGRWLAVNGMIG